MANVPVHLYVDIIEPVGFALIGSGSSASR